MKGSGRAAIDRLSTNDLMELVCDVSGTSMQLAAVLTLGGELDPDAIRLVMADRITAVPRMRQRLLRVPFWCGRPVWVDDPTFHLSNHLTTVACPAPGDDTALLDVVAERLTEPLDPGRPLWSMTLVTGMSCRRSALVVVFHHVLADGMAGLAILERLVDGPPPTVNEPRTQPPPSRRAMTEDMLRRSLRGVRRLPVTVCRLSDAVAELGHGRAGAPRTSLNRPVGCLREVRVARADLRSLQQAAHSHSCTVNDVLLNAVAGALGSVLAARGEHVDHLVIAVPVSARSEVQADELGNQVGVIPVPVPTTGTAARRLTATTGVTRARRVASRGSSAALIGPVFRLLARLRVFGWFINRQRLVNSFLSNLRGPAHQLHVLGTPITDLTAVGTLSGNIPVAFTALSYAGEVTVAVVADPLACPDLTAIAAALQDQLGQMVGPAAAQALP